MNSQGVGGPIGCGRGVVASMVSTVSGGVCRRHDTRRVGAHTQPWDVCWRRMRRQLKRDAPRPRIGVNDLARILPGSTPAAEARS
jgi:hypothetical protein